jgi:uncharacterized protein
MPFKIKKMRRLIFLLFILSITGLEKNFAQNSQLYEGDIIIDSTLKIKVQFNIYIDSITNEYSSKLNVPIQSIKDYPVKILNYSLENVVFEMKGMLFAEFIGKFANNEIVGIWKQSGRDFPLTLKMVESVNKVRPQNPQKPYPYIAKDTIYFNSDNSIQYGATLTIPKTNKPYPAVILVTGSGQQDRDETIFDHKPFWIIADYLTRRGIAVLRVDDRGVGQTTGDVEKATSETFSTDVLNSIEFLKTIPGIDKNCIGLIGHSEGSMISFLAANNSDDISFIVSMAGLGVTGKEVALSQIEYGLKKSQLPENSVDEIMTLYTSIIEIISVNSDESVKKARILEHLNNWIPKQDSMTKVGVGLIYNEKIWTSKSAGLDVSLTRMMTPWMQYFISYNPKEILKNVDCPILVLNGQKDMQVYSEQNINGFKSIAIEFNKKNYEFHEFPDLNHLFQHCKTGDVSEYYEIEETISPEVLELIYNWINRTIEK